MSDKRETTGNELEGMGIGFHSSDEPDWTTGSEPDIEGLEKIIKSGFAEELGRRAAEHVNKIFVDCLLNELQKDDLK